MSGGFTLIEMAVVLGIISILIALSVPAYITLRRQNDLELAKTIVAQSLRQAQLRAQAGVYDGPWGVKTDTGQVTVFQGDSYAAREADRDQLVAVSNQVNFSDVTEVIFAAVSGEPQTTGDMTFTVAGQTGMIAINAKGIPQY